MKVPPGKIRILKALAETPCGLFGIYLARAAEVRYGIAIRFFIELEEDGLIKGNWQPGLSPIERKFFTITDDGLRLIKGMMKP